MAVWAAGQWADQPGGVQRPHGARGWGCSTACCMCFFFGLRGSANAIMRHRTIDASPVVCRSKNARARVRARALRARPFFPPSPLPPRALFNLIKRLTKETELFLDLCSLIPLYGESRTRAAARISSAGAHPCEGGTTPWRPTRSLVLAVIERIHRLRCSIN
jgi:hypothetical protein